MNNKAAKLAAEHYEKTLDEVEVSRIDFFMSLWAALDGADAAGQTAAGYEVPPAERVAALSEAEIPVFSNAPVEIDAEALARGMSVVIAALPSWVGLTPRWPLRLRVSIGMTPLLQAMSPWRERSRWSIWPRSASSWWTAV